MIIAVYFYEEDDVLVGPFASKTDAINAEAFYNSPNILSKISIRAEPIRERVLSALKRNKK